MVDGDGPDGDGVPDPDRGVPGEEIWYGDPGDDQVTEPSAQSQVPRGFAPLPVAAAAPGAVPPPPAFPDGSSPLPPPAASFSNGGSTSRPPTKPKQSAGRLVFLVALLAVTLGVAAFAVTRVKDRDDAESATSTPISQPTIFDTTPTSATSAPIASTSAPTTTTVPSDPEAPWKGIESVAVGQSGGPSEIAVGHGSVWLTDRLANRVVRLDPDTNEVEASIAVEAPLNVVTSDSAVWVFSDTDPSTSSRIDPSTNEVVSAAELPGFAAQPFGDGATVWYATFTMDGTSELFRLDDQSGKSTSEAIWDDNIIERVVGDGEDLWVEVSDGIEELDLESRVSWEERRYSGDATPPYSGSPVSLIWFADLGDPVARGVDPITRKEMWRQPLPHPASRIVATPDAVWVLSSDGTQLSRFGSSAGSSDEAVETHTTGAPYNTIAVVGDDLWLIGGDGENPTARMPLDQG